MDRAKEIIRKLLSETTFPAYAGESCRSCDGDYDAHKPDCPWLLAVTEAEEFLNG